MSNYIRACFCVPQSIESSKFYDLLVVLSENNCTYNSWIRGSVQGYLTRSEQKIDIQETETDLLPISTKLLRIAKWLSEPGYLTVKLGWNINQNIYQTEITQIWRDEFATRSIRLCTEEKAFLPGNLTEFTPYNDNLFTSYKDLVTEFIKHTLPSVGVLDYEADLLCDSINDLSSLVSWGNFYSKEYLAQWISDDINKVVKVVDEFQKVDELGVLTFIHPLQANQAWTDRHEQVRNILQPH